MTIDILKWKVNNYKRKSYLTNGLAHLSLPRLSVSKDIENNEKRRMQRKEFKMKNNELIDLGARLKLINSA